MLTFIRPANSLPGLDWGQTTKGGGVSSFGESRKGGLAFQQNTLNLATHVDDLPDAVIENWRRFEAATPWSRKSVATCQQVHSDKILEVSSGNHHLLEADALISRRPGLAVGVFTADCIPILVADAEHRHVAAIHCGWKGVAANLAGKTITQLVETDDQRRENLLVWIGAAIRCDSYEVGAEVALQFDTSVYRASKPGKFQLDLVKAVKQQLLTAGITKLNIEDCQIDTYTSNKDIFSYRADGKNTGRMMTFVGFLG